MAENHDPSGGCPSHALEQLFDAIGKGDREQVAGLLREHPSLVNTPNPTWDRPAALHAAAERADPAMIALLLERGADPASADAFGNTPLHRVASAKAATEAIDTSIRLLAERSAGLIAVNHNGHTPLREAVWKDSRRAQERLRERGAPLTAPRPTWTPPVEVVTAVTRVLSDAWRGPVTLGHAYQLREERVLRFEVAAAPEANGQPAPASVVVKRALKDPDDVLLEWAGLRFLTELPGSGEYALRLYGGDREAGLFVMEDLGDGEALVDRLMGDDPRQAEEGLRLLAVSLGRMHAESAGRRDRYQAHREAMGQQLSSRWWHDLREGREMLPPGFQALGVAPAVGFDEELDQVERSVNDPGPFLAYVHGDPCPDNCRIRDNRVRLFDFTGPGFRHALLDALYGRVPFPSCWCVNRLPARVPPMMEAAYRAELIHGCPEAGDDARFNRELVHCMAAWMLINRTWWLGNAHTLIHQDWQWGISTWRQRVLVRLDAFAETTAQLGYLPAMGDTARGCAQALRQIWPPEADAMPFYPAFR